MNMHTGRQRRFPVVTIVVVLFILCIVPGQFLTGKLFPGISGLVQINPGLVFLDIPIHLPVVIDLILAPGLFFLIYPVVVLFYPSRPGIPFCRQMLIRIKSAFMGLFALLCCMLCGGLIYYLVQDYLPRNVLTGINTFGINADIHLSYPAHETIYLRGSMVLLVCFVTGMFICMRKIRKEPGAALTREQRMTPYERMLQEKRMKEKQMKQEARQIQKEGMKKEEYKAPKGYKPAPIEQVTIEPHCNGRSRVCHSEPVISLTPLAVNYMPM